jgi:pimeloyl-ACP methyl ester carboxylesterase
MSDHQAHAELPTRSWSEPAGLRVRGSVAVIGGRGETADVYERFGRRISADAYRVLAFGDIGAQVAQAATQIRTALADGRLVKPLTLVGSDTGSIRVVDVLPSIHDAVDALALAGYPVAGVEAAADWETETKERTTCPAHRAVLTADIGVTRGLLAHGLSAEDVARDLGAIEKPVLAIHGAADLISPVDQAKPIYAVLPHGEVWTVAAAKHDVLNDSAHRSAAALLVTFLERLGRGSVDTPILTRVS